MSKILQDIDKFLELNPECSPSGIGREAIGDPGLYSGIKDRGRSIGEKTAEKVRKYMSEYSRKKKAALTRAKKQGHPGTATTHA